MDLTVRAGYLRQTQLPGHAGLGAVLTKMPGMKKHAYYGPPESALPHLHLFERAAG